MSVSKENRELTANVPMPATGVLLDERQERRESRTLEEMERRYHSLIRGAVHGFCRTNSSGVLIEVNPALAEMMGYANEKELIGMNLLDEAYVYPTDAASTMNLMKGGGGISGGEAQWYRKDGKPITVRVSGRKVSKARHGAAEFEFITEDVTEKRELERQLRQAQKMEAMARLAGCIAHDFNNLLGIILGYCEVLSEKFAQHPELGRPVFEIKKAGKRAASLTEQLLAFSRKQVMVSKVHDLNSVVNETMNLLYRVIGEDVEITTTLASEPVGLNADRGSLVQAIVQLAMHARDSMPSGGGLSLTTTIREIDPAFAEEHTPMPVGTYVSLAISDTGSGMSLESQGRVFEPFYRTQRDGARGGLGLAAVYGIVKQNGGYIWVESGEGKGSTFSMLFPHVRGPVSPDESRSGAVLPPREMETVLVVEDLPALRELIVGFLQESGYSPLAAAHGQSALDLASAHSGAIHLLLSDVSMPGMSGPQLAERLRVARPELIVLYMSGFADDPSIQAHLATPNTAFVRKPFSRQGLILKIREVLDAASSEADR